MSTKTPLNPISSDSTAREQVYEFRIGRAVALRLGGHSMVLAFLAAGIFSTITSSCLGNTSIGWVQPILYLVVYFGVMVAHELVHGVFFRIFGGHPKYGAGLKYFLPYFSTTSPKDAFSVRQMLMIALAPLLIISTSTLLLAPIFPSLMGYFAVAFIGNTAGAVGDLWMTSRLMPFLPIRDARVFDLSDRLAIHSREAAAGQIAQRLLTQDKRPAGFFEHWIGASFVIFMFGTLAGFIVPIFVDALLIGPSQMPLIAFTRTGGQGITWTFNVAVPLLAGLIFAIAVRLFSFHRSKSTSAWLWK